MKITRPLDSIELIAKYGPDRPDTNARAWCDEHGIECEDLPALKLDDPAILETLEGCLHVETIGTARISGDRLVLEFDDFFDNFETELAVLLKMVPTVPVSHCLLQSLVELRRTGFPDAMIEADRVQLMDRRVIDYMSYMEERARIVRCHNTKYSCGEI